MKFASVPTKTLFQFNSLAAAAGEESLAHSTGRELMRRTDTSPERIEQSNAECADRAERHPA